MKKFLTKKYIAYPLAVVVALTTVSFSLVFVYVIGKLISPILLKIIEIVS